MHARARRQPQPHLLRADIHRLADGSHVRRGAQLRHRQPAEEVVHGGVAHHHRVHHLVNTRPGFVAQFRQQAVGCIHQAGLQGQVLLHAAVGIGNAADHVLAVGNLRVHHPAASQGAARAQIHQVCRQLGGAHIHGKTQQGSARRQCPHQLHAARVRAQRQPRLPVPAAQRARDLSPRRKFSRRLRQIRLAQRRLHPRLVRAQILNVRGFQG